MTNERFFDTCRNIVMRCDVTVLIVNVLGTYKAFLVNSFSPKSGHALFNRVDGAKDITVLVEQYVSNFPAGFSNQVLMERTQSVPKMSMQFGTDDYMWITKCEINM